MPTENFYQQFFTGTLRINEPIILPKPTSLPNYVVIDGNSGAGKTTTAVIVSSRSGLSHIGEYGNYLDHKSGEKFPNFPPLNIDEVIKSHPLWTHLELRRREHQIFSSLGKPETMQVVERSPLSLIAFEYAKMQQGIPFEISMLLEKYLELYKMGILIEPSGYIFITVSPESVRDRIKNVENNPTLQFLCSSRTITSINDFIERFCAKYIDPEKYLKLNSDTDTQEEMAIKIIDFVNKITSFKKPTNGISALATQSQNGDLIF